MQAVQAALDVAPRAAVEAPAPQLVQTAGAIVRLEYVPAAHKRHAVPAVYEPAPQDVHAAEVAAAARLEKRPAPQTVQAAAPVADQYAPAAHAVQKAELLACSAEE